jgi:methanogenic corrinoid protein MtbC1
VSAFAERGALAERVRALRLPAAEAATGAFLQSHPDWLARYGDLARLRGVEDALFHVDFLAGALQAGSTSPFEAYARWAARVLQARGIAPSFLAENLGQVEDALAARLAPAELVPVKACLAAGRAALGAPEEVASAPESPLALTRSVFLQALRGGHRRAAANAVLEALREGHATEEVYVDVLQSALVEIGALWESNRISVAEEHMATAIAQFVLGEVYPRLPTSAERRGRAVVTGVRGELHQVGAHMVADLLDTRGWDVRFLGTDAPHEAILRTVEAHRADLVGISATMLFNVPKVAALVADLRKRAPVRVILGGGAFRFAPGLYREIGADAFAADLRELLDPRVLGA